MWVQSGCGLWLCLPAFWRVCWCGSVRLSRLQDLPEVGSGPLVVCSLLFSPLCCSALGALIANMALFRVFKAFLEGFGVVAWVCVVLVACVACVVFVRVWS